MSDKFFDNLTKEFKTIAEYKNFAQAQNETILELSKKIHNLEEEIRNQKIEKKEVISLDTSISNEEMICLTQLRILNESSRERELTLEEAKKVDIFTKILSQINSQKEKGTSDEAGLLSSEELLKIVENGTT